MSDSLYLILPAYNEEENIRRTVEEWYEVLESHRGGGASRMVVVDDGSRDRTCEILRELAEDRPLLEVLAKPNGGHGEAVLFGYRYALSRGADYIFQTDSDGQTDPGEFETFWRRRRRYEAVFGCRRKRGDGLQRLAVEKVLCGILWFCFGVSLPDANAPYRLMRASYVRDCLALLPGACSLPNVMLTVFGRYFHRRICFLPITFLPRRAGKNSIGGRRLIRIGLGGLREFCRIRTRWREDPGRKRF